MARAYGARNGCPQHILRFGILDFYRRVASFQAELRASLAAWSDAKPGNKFADGSRAPLHLPVLLPHYREFLL